MKDFGILWIWGFCGDSHRFFCGYGIGMGIKIQSPRQPWWWGYPMVKKNFEDMYNSLHTDTQYRRVTDDGQTDRHLVRAMHTCRAVKTQYGWDLLSWILSPKCKTRFSQKLSNLELSCLLLSYIGSSALTFQWTDYWTPKKMAEICHLENRHDIIFLPWDKILQTGAEWHADGRLRWYGRN